MSKQENKHFLSQLSELDNAQREIAKKRKKIVIQCAHQNDKGKLKIQPVDDDGTYQCKFCKATFSMDPISSSDLKEASDTLHNALQQIRCYSDVKEDDKIIRLLGELDFNIQESIELYDRVVNVYSRNTKKDKKNKNRHQESMGEYGSSGLSFINTRKQRR